MTLYDHRGEFLTREEMTTLEYILYDQCNSRKFGPIEPERRALEGKRRAEKFYSHFIHNSHHSRYIVKNLMHEKCKAQGSTLQASGIFSNSLPAVLRRQ